MLLFNLIRAPEKYDCWHQRSSWIVPQEQDIKLCDMETGCPTEDFWVSYGKGQPQAQGCLVLLFVCSIKENV